MGEYTLYKDATQPVERRLEDLIGRMTIEEKVGQLASYFLDMLTENDEFSEAKMKQAEENLAVGVLHSFRWGVNRDTARQMEVTNAAQRYLVEKTRLGIPAIITAEGVHGHLSTGATVFPHAIALGSTFDPDLVGRVSSVVAREARAVGVGQILSPVLDLARDARWGRCQETYGEDPYLTSRMGVAFIKGLQGDGPIVDSEHCAATPKHFAAHGSPEAGMNLAPVHTGERELRDTYLPAFKAAVCEAGALSVMSAYHELDGIPCTASKFLLTKVLREEWGFQGYTYSDWDAINMLYSFHKTAGSFSEAGKQALEAGMDLEAPMPLCFGRNLLALVKAGQVAVADADTAVRRVLRLKFLLGLFENPYCDIEKAAKIRNCDEHRALARQVARESIVLLKNEGKLLPLRKDIGKIAVIGPNADVPQLGDYSGTNDKLVSVLEGIRGIVSSGTIVTHAKGCGIWELSTDGIPEAVEAAKNADVAVVVVGESNEVSFEGNDTHDLELPGVQMELVKAVQGTGTPTVVVLLNGRPLSISWIAEHVPAILEAWYPGEEGGNAIAEILFGGANPCGKLPVSIPRSVGHVPVHYNHKPSARGYYHKPGEPGKPGRDYVFAPPTPLYEFGHGLSYTEFAYSDLRVEPKQILPGAEVEVAVTVKNTGDVSGKEVVRLYLTDVVSSTSTPVKALKRFRKVSLAPGEEQTVRFTLLPEDLALIDRHMEWTVEPGEFRVMIGGLEETFEVVGGATITDVYDPRRAVQAQDIG